MKEILIKERKMTLRYECQEKPQEQKANTLYGSWNVYLGQSYMQTWGVGSGHTFTDWGTGTGTHTKSHRHTHKITQEGTLSHTEGEKVTQPNIQQPFLTQHTGQTGYIS